MGEYTFASVPLVGSKAFFLPSQVGGTWSCSAAKPISAGEQTAAVTFNVNI